MDIVNILVQLLVAGLLSGVAWFIIRLTTKVDELSKSNVSKEDVDKHIDGLGNKIIRVETRLDRLFELVLSRKEHHAKDE